MDTLLSSYLNHQEKQFDKSVGLLGVVWQGPGYHTQIPNGTFVHTIRENLGYALTLLGEGSPDAVQRAEAILKIILPLQDKNSASPTYGVWPWLWEESLEQMRPPDWNWADFCGVRLAHMIVLYSSRLSIELLLEMKEALRAAAYSIFRRNVTPVYTNIAVKGGIVTGIAGEVFGDTVLLEYSCSRLRRFMKHVNYHGGFSEYNSPNYGLLVLTEVERGLLLFRDKELRGLMSQIHEFLWQRIADSLHLSTGQMSGPQSRAYQDILPAVSTDILEKRLGIELPCYSNPEPDLEQEAHFMIPAVPCPDLIRHKILNQTSETFARYEYVKSDDPEERRVGSIWKHQEACLGSINYDNLWVQRRPILGYWPVDGQLAVLRVRMTHDGRDFASGFLKSQQERNELVALCGLVTDKGDFHDHLDKPVDGIFHIANLQLAIELTAPEAEVRQIGERIFILSAGKWSVLLQPAMEQFSNYTVRWGIESRQGFVAVRAVVNEGKMIKLKPAEMQASLIGFYLALSQEPVLSVKMASDYSVDQCTLSTTTQNTRLELKASLSPRSFRHIQF